MGWGRGRTVARVTDSLLLSNKAHFGQGFLAGLAVFFVIACLYSVTHLDDVDVTDGIVEDLY